MRTLAFAAVALALSATTALAAPAQVSVTIGPELQAKAEKEYGVRDVNDLADQLKRDVEHELGRTRRFDDARVELVLTDAKPSRPTFKQLSNRLGLSYSSVSSGGAAVEGHVVHADGSVTPVDYRDYAPNLAWARTYGTWADADHAVERLARQLARSGTLASR